MPLPTVPVFVSSTWSDLEPERRAVEAAVQRLRETKFVGMEYFGSRDETTRRASLDEVDRSRVYLGIIAGRYGSGITEAEYERARRRGLPCLVYFKADATIPGGLREKDPAQAAKLDAFKQRLRAGHIEAPDFTSPDDLAAKVTADLHRWLFDEYLTPILERAARGEAPSAQAQALLSGVRDMSALSPGLVAQLTARHQLRAPVGDFVGREKEIADLTAALRGGGSATISSISKAGGISGMGGVGKTELAFYVANELRDAFPDTQLVLDMRGTDERPRDPADALATCIRAFLGLEQPLPGDEEELTRIYRSTLEGKRALILLDNASDGAQVRPLLPPAGSALLVTSRNAVTLPGMKTRVTLEQLSPAEARELLTGIARHVAPEVADEICDLCGYLPLAIRAAGSLLDVTADLEPETYAAQLRDERRRLELIGAEGVDLGVEASFGLSYARLAPDAARVFRRLSAFPASFDARAEEAICEDPGHKHLSDLLRRNLVRYNTDARRYRLHDLARLFADSLLSGEERWAGQLRHAEHYLSVLEECRNSYLEGGEKIKYGLKLFNAERPNIEAGQRWACLHAGTNETAARLCNTYPTAGVHVISLRQNPREFILWLEAALAAARQLEDRTAEVGHLSHLGITYTALGETRRAIEHVEQALVIARQMGNRDSEGKVLVNLGRAFEESGDYHRAIDCYEQRLAIARETDNRRGEGTALANLGNAHKHLGEARRAIEYCEQALVVFREMGDQLSESYVLGNLGSAYLDLKDASRSLELFDKVLAVAREMGDKYSEGNSLYGLSQAFDMLGDRARAFAHAEAALEIYQQIESPNADEVRATLAKWRGDATKGSEGL